MMDEIKIRITDYKETENKLKASGCKFFGEADIVDTYFIAPKGVVLKITEGSEGSFLVNLKSNDGKFRIVKREKIDDAVQIKKQLATEQGVKCVLKKKIRFWALGSARISIQLIEGVGEFLILEGENLKPEIITSKLQINNPEFITVSFDELKRKSDS